MNQEAPTYFEILGAVTRKERTYWTRIGVAFPTKDGTGFRLDLDYAPVSPDAEIVMLPPRAKEAADSE